MQRAGLLMLLVACAGCATIAHGTRQTVTITSDPSGASVTVLSKTKDGGEILRSTPGVTPIKLELTRGDSAIVIRVRKDGCAAVDVALKRSVSGGSP
jgi:hypothetical protein